MQGSCLSSPCSNPRQPPKSGVGLLQRWGALWGRGQRRHSSASSDDGEDVSTNAQGTAEVIVDDPQNLQHAAGPAATTRCMHVHAVSKGIQHLRAASAGSVLTTAHGGNDQKSVHQRAASRVQGLVASVSN